MLPSSAAPLAANYAKIMAKTGRPTSYPQEIADAICDEIATTDHALSRICEREGMPDVRTVYRWLEANEDFRQQ